MQMGMATQLLFTFVVTLMKVAILLTYLRTFFPVWLPNLAHPLRHLPLQAKQVVLLCHALLYRLA
jgi:hypothetical protein